MGYGTFSFWPTVRLLQEAGRLLRMMTLWTETPKVTAIPPHVSPAATVYSNGACSVAVGSAVWELRVGGTGRRAARSAVPVGMAVGLTTRCVADRPA